MAYLIEEDLLLVAPKRRTQPATIPCKYVYI